MYPKLGAVPTPTGEEGEADVEANVPNEYADEGQEQSSTICKKWKRFCSMRTMAVAIIFIVSCIIGGVFLHHHLTNAASPEEVGIDDELQLIHWTLKNLDALKPIFAVDCIAHTSNQVTPMFFQWVGWYHSGRPPALVFRMVFIRKDDESNSLHFYLSDKVRGPDQTVDGPDEELMYVTHGQDLVLNSGNEDKWELPLGDATKFQYQLQNHNHVVVNFKRVVRQDGNEVKQTFQPNIIPNHDGSKPMRWTMEDLNKFKPIFSVDFSTRGSNDITPILLQWRRGTRELGIFQLVMRLKSNPSEFYAYWPCNTQHQTQMFPDSAKMDDVFGQHCAASQSSNIVVNFSESKRTNHEQWELPSGGIPRLEDGRFKVIFKQVVRKDRNGRMAHRRH